MFQPGFGAILGGCGHWFRERLLSETVICSSASSAAIETPVETSCRKRIGHGSGISALLNNSTQEGSIDTTLILC